MERAGRCYRVDPAVSQTYVFGLVGRAVVDPDVAELRGIPELLGRQAVVHARSIDRGVDQEALVLAAALLEHDPRALELAFSEAPISMTKAIKPLNRILSKRLDIPLELNRVLSACLSTRNGRAE